MDLEILVYQFIGDYKLGTPRWLNLCLGLTLTSKDNSFIFLFQGICPGNRLRIVAGVFDASGAMQRRRARAPAPVAHQPMPTQQSPAFTKVSS